jgi:hypothetical protein
VVVSDICGVKALQWLCAIGCVRFARVGGRCAVRSGAWWFFIEIWKLSVISESTTAFCGVFWRYLLVSNKVSISLATYVVFCGVHASVLLAVLWCLPATSGRYRWVS